MVCHWVLHPLPQEQMLQGWLQAEQGQQLPGRADSQRAAETPLLPATSGAEAAMFAADFPSVLLAKETEGSARGDINLAHPSSACDDTHNCRGAFGKHNALSG